MNQIQQGDAAKTERHGNRYSYTNRKGDTYFLHKGATKLGKPKYFFSRSPDGGLAKIPSGFEVAESINAIVSLARVRPLLIPAEDLQIVQVKVGSLRHLAHHRVEGKVNTISIYTPVGLDAIEQTKSDTFSILASFKPFLQTLGRDTDSFLSEIAAKAGMTVEQFKQLDAKVATDKRDKFTAHLRKNIQYDPVMRFVLDKKSGQYRADRRCYRNEEDWLTLGVGLDQIYGGEIHQAHRQGVVFRLILIRHRRRPPALVVSCALYFTNKALRHFQTLPMSQIHSSFCDIQPDTGGRDGDALTVAICARPS